jgi:hypothetical protein
MVLTVSASPFRGTAACVDDNIERDGFLAPASAEVDPDDFFFFSADKIEAALARCGLTTGLRSAEGGTFSKSLEESDSNSEPKDSISLEITAFLDLVDMEDVDKKS